MSDTLTVRETFERPSAEYPQGSYLFRVGGRFIQATGRFSELAAQLDPEGWRFAQFASLHRCLFVNLETPKNMTLPWWMPNPCKALVKEGPKAMVAYGG